MGDGRFTSITRMLCFPPVLYYQRLVMASASTWLQVPIEPRANNAPLTQLKHQGLESFSNFPPVFFLPSNSLGISLNEVNRL